MIQKHFLLQNHIYQKGIANHLQIKLLLDKLNLNQCCILCRFSPENFTDRAKEAYIPFGDGPRRCIGEVLVYAELRVIISNIVKKFKIELLPNQSEKIHSDIITRFEKAPKFILTER